MATLKTCAIDGCDGPARKRGWCPKHYQRWLANGDPLKARPKRPNGAGFVALGYLAREIDGKKKFEHVRIAEAALGRSLPPGAVVHHADRNRMNNAPTNLVICPDRPYHNLIHARMDAMDACGNPDWRRCRHCRTYDAIENLRVYPHDNTTSYWHPSCASIAAKSRRAA